VTVNPLRWNEQPDTVAHSDLTFALDPGHQSALAYRTLRKCQPTTRVMLFDDVGRVTARYIFKIDNERRTKTSCALKVAAA
jgi:hypothetical protein